MATRVQSRRGPTGRGEVIPGPKPQRKMEECPGGRSCDEGMKALGTFILENRFRERHDSPAQIFKGLSHKREIKLVQRAPGDSTELRDQKSQLDRSQLHIKKEFCNHWNLPEKTWTLDFKRINRTIPEQRSPPL